MFARTRHILNGNLAFMPLVLLHAALGFYLESAKNKKFKILRATHSSLALILLLSVSPLIRYSADDGSIVVATITYINSRCIYFTLIIIYIRSVIARKSLRSVFKCLDNIDRRLQTTFNVKIKDDDSKWFMRVMLIVLLASAFGSFAIECFNERALNVGHFVHAMLVFILSVKISLYCMLCASIKVRFKALVKYLRDSKSSRQQQQQPMFVVKPMKCVMTTTKTTRGIGNVSQVKEISLIYDEVLEIISLMNESFSALLSAAFGKPSSGWGLGRMKYVVVEGAKELRFPGNALNTGSCAITPISAHSEKLSILVSFQSQQRRKDSKAEPLKHSLFPLQAQSSSASL